MKNSLPRYYAVIVSFALTLFWGIALFVWTIPPYHQMTVFFKSLMASRGDRPTAVIDHAKESFEPYTYAQPSIRFQYMDYLFGEFLKHPTPTPPPELSMAVEYLQDSVEREPNYAPHLLALGKAYDLLANLNPNQALELRKKAEKQYLAGLAVFPNNPRLSYSYAINLANQGRMSEGLALLEKVRAGDPRVVETDYYLGALYYMQDNIKNSDKALELFERSLDKDVNPLGTLTESIYKKMLTYYYGRGDVEHFVIVARRLEGIVTDESATYKSILDYIEKNKTLPSINFNSGS